MLYLCVMSDKGLLRFNIILSELSITTYKSSDFDQYNEWFVYFNTMLQLKVTKLQTLVKKWLFGLVDKLYKIYGINYKELTNMVLNFFNRIDVVDYYKFTKYTYIGHGMVLNK